MKTKRPLENTDLDHKEWCFQSIPEGEMDACYIYEYSRELGGPCDLGAFAIRPPNIAWQELDQKVRSEFVKRLTSMRQFLSLTMEPESETDITNIQKFRRDYGEWDTSKYDLERTEFGFFAINWRYGDREIKRRFAEWLSERREQVEARGWAEDYKAKARGGSMDRLNWLGALRVRKHYPKRQLVDYTDTNLKVDAPYSHLPDLYKNAKKAEKLLKIFSELFDRS